MNTSDSTNKQLSRREYQRRWQREHPEKCRQYARDWYSKHPDYAKQWREKNREHLNEYERLRRRNSPEHHRARRERRKQVRLEVLAHYGGKCACCGERNTAFLVIDHINGGGTKLRNQKINPRYIPGWLKAHNYPPGFRVLCHNCNAAYAIYKSCPHQHNKTIHDRLSPMEVSA